MLEVEDVRLGSALLLCFPLCRESWSAVRADEGHVQQKEMRLEGKTELLLVIVAGAAPVPGMVDCLALLRLFPRY